MLSNYQVIIRSAYERTEALCLHLIQQQVPVEQVVVIHERPFYYALQRSFEIGVEAGYEWTLCIDADVLVLPEVVQGLIAFAATQPPDSFGASGLVLDKFRMGLRRGGLHLYRTKLLPKALTAIRESNDIEFQLRPETYVKHKMLALGYPWRLWDEAVGIHDYEQFYTDIYRKMVVRARKSSNEKDGFLAQALTYSLVDQDFLVATWGLRVGQGIQTPILLDSEQWRVEAALLLVANGIQEKDALDLVNTEALVMQTYQKQASWLSGKLSVGFQRAFSIRRILKRIGARFIQLSNS